MAKPQWTLETEIKFIFRCLQFNEFFFSKIKKNEYKILIFGTILAVFN